MSFVFPLLLGGLVLAGIPVLLHLIMRQQPKHLPFPAMRFLMQRHRTNQRKLQLRHLLLLALRMLLIAAVCLALARPRVFSERFGFSADRPQAAVFVIDTSYSMEYTAGEPLLDRAKRRAQELLDGLPEGSRVAVLDTAESAGDWVNLSVARERVAALQLRAANGPVTAQLGHAYDLLERLGQEQNNPAEALLPFVYVFSDRTQASWDAGQLESLRRQRDRLPPPGARAVYVDVGVEKPADLGIVKLELPRQVVAANQRLFVRATVQATGDDFDTEVICRFDGEKTEDRKPVKLQAGKSQVVIFERQGFGPGIHKVEVALVAPDNLAFDNTRFASFLVQGPRKVLTITDEPRDAAVWKLALEVGGDQGEMAFECKVLTPEQAGKLALKDLAAYQAVCLLSVAEPTQELWKKLGAYVNQGGGLAVIPGGDSWRNLRPYNEGAAQELLPGRLGRIVTADSEAGVEWDPASFQDPVKTWFRVWRQEPNVGFLQFPPKVYKHWLVKQPGQPEWVVVRYADRDHSPAFLERSFDRQKGGGRVVLLTVPLDESHSTGEKRWHNYIPGLVPFYVALAKKTVGYLAGDSEETNFNFQSGQVAAVSLPATSRLATYTVQGPGLTGSEAVVARSQEQAGLAVPQAVLPGHYTVFGEGKPLAGFSLNIAPDECLLTRVPGEQIEALLGQGALLPLERSANLRDALQSHWSQPVELLPWLMILFLVLLAVENLLANRFYRREAGDTVKDDRVTDNDKVTG